MTAAETGASGKNDEPEAFLKLFEAVKAFNAALGRTPNALPPKIRIRAALKGLPSEVIELLRDGAVTFAAMADMEYGAKLTEERCRNSKEK